MTPDERTMLSGFLQDLVQARGGLKDAEAAGLIDQAIKSNPDAAYLLVQHAILADQALHAAQAKVAELEAQQRDRQSAPRGSGFGSFLGAGSPWARAAPPPPPQYSQPQYSQPQYAPAYAAPPPQQGPGLFGTGGAQPGGFGTFLRSAGTMAAGVAGGSLIADALGGMFGGHHGGFGGGFGGGYGGGFGGPEVENVTINEYGDQGMGGGLDNGGFGDGGFGSDGGGFDDGGGF
jgi:hypothetical protein